MTLARLIIVQFPIRNHRWKAQNLLYPFKLSYVVLQSRSAPLNGRLRYIDPWFKLEAFNYYCGTTRDKQNFPSSFNLMWTSYFMHLLLNTGKYIFFPYVNMIIDD